MNDINNSISQDLSLEEVLTRLSLNREVAGVLQIGSLMDGPLRVESDYDLVIILDEAPNRWFVGVTQIDHRFTDLIFVSRSALDDFLNLDAPIEQGEDLAPIIRWLRDGQIIYANDDLVHAAQDKVKSSVWIEPVREDASYGAWFQINYNLAQLKRMIQSMDGLYQQVVDIRMAVYGTTDLWFGYFAIRKMVWSGDKDAIRYLSDYDPEFLLAFQQFAASDHNRNEKFEAYERAARIATEPMGGIWSEGATVMNLPRTSQLWQRLLKRG